MMVDESIEPSPPAPLPRTGEGRRGSFPSGAFLRTEATSIDDSPSPSGGRGVGERERKARLLRHAKAMRSNPTEAEQRLWHHLRAKRFMGLKFKRQSPVGPFIADFVCLQLKLIIEVDGGQHGGLKDKRRDAWFARQGFRVLRFWNNEVLGQTEAVLESICEVVGALSSERERRGLIEKGENG